MTLWKQIRLPLLVITSINVLFVFGKVILAPNIGKQTVPSFVFPPVVPLPQWQLIASDPITEKTAKPPQSEKSVLSGRRYRYIQNNQPLDIEMRYEVGTEGDVKQFITQQAAIPFSLNQPGLVLRQQKGLGFYGLFVYQQRAYLDACINSRGSSTFTHEQFITNRKNYDLRLGRLVPWLLGQQRLYDNRCLWAHLSIPLNNSSPESAYPILEKAWFSWYQWWFPRFQNH